jgi:branched-chain amino acid transport system substrate-binding protein
MILKFLFIFTFLASLLGCNNNIPDVMKIGVAQPLSGNLAPQGNDLLNGVKLAVTELNKAGSR